MDKGTEYKLVVEAYVEQIARCTENMKDNKRRLKQIRVEQKILNNNRQKAQLTLDKLLGKTK